MSSLHGTRAAPPVPYGLSLSLPPSLPPSLSPTPSILGCAAPVPEDGLYCSNKDRRVVVLAAISSCASLVHKNHGGAGRRRQISPDYGRRPAVAACLSSDDVHYLLRLTAAATGEKNLSWRSYGGSLTGGGTVIFWIVFSPTLGRYGDARVRSRIAVASPRYVDARARSSFCSLSFALSRARSSFCSLGFASSSCVSRGKKKSWSMRRLPGPRCQIVWCQ